MAAAPARNRTLLGIFARHWEPGKVKTRLAVSIGESHAATLHALCVMALADRFAAAGDERVIAFTPPAAEHAFCTVAQGRWEVWPQIEGDLGQRMQGFFDSALTKAERVILIGSDSPDLPREFVEQAFAALETSDVVLGPAQDGGYYLIGAARRVPPVFEGIAWSTPQVWPQTIARLQAARARWCELPVWYDVDDGADLAALLVRLRSSGRSDPALARLAEQLHPLLSGPPPGHVMHDVLIIGGGVIGLSLAWHLARHGRSVQVIDRGQPGREASWAGAGILPPANRVAAIHPYDQLRALASELHPAWAAELKSLTGIDTGYRCCGGLYLARTPGEAASLAAWAATLMEEGIRVDRLSQEQLADLEPELNFTQSAIRNPQSAIAWLLPDESQLRNPRHLKALLAACTTSGVEITPNIDSTDFVIHNGRLAEIQTSAGPLCAEQFCFTAGAWTGQLLQRLGIATGVLPIRGQMVLFRTERPLIRRIINEGSRYLVPRDDGRLLAGSTEEEVGFDKRTTAEAIAELTAFARALVPGLASAEIEQTWAGLRPGSFDGLPYLGPLPGLANAFVAAGHYRHGLYLSPATAVVMGELLRGERPTIDLSPFRVGR